MSLNLFAVTSSAWQQAKGGSIHAIRAVNVASPGAGVVVKVDLAAAKGLPGCDMAVDVIAMSTLVRQYSAHYEPDADAIRSTLVLAARHRADVIVDAGAFTKDVLLKVLTEAREQAYSMDAWPASVSVVCRDDIVEAVTDDLARAFFLMPNRKSIGEASSYAVRIHRAAAYARVFMWSQAVTNRAVRLRERISKITKALFKSDETEMV